MRMMTICAVTLGIMTGGAFGASAAEYEIDPNHSFALFKVKHLGASWTYGNFAEVTGTFRFDPDSPEDGSVRVTIPTESLVTFNKSRDQHLKGPDFFKVKEFPEMTFVSTAWKPLDEDTYQVTGDFTLLGKSQEITVEVDHVGTGANPQSGAELRGFHTTFTLDRTDFGMTYGVSEGGGGLGKEVEVIVSIEGIKQ